MALGHMELVVDRSLGFEAGKASGCYVDVANSPGLVGHNLPADVVAVDSWTVGRQVRHMLEPGNLVVAGEDMGCWIAAWEALSLLFRI